MKGTDLIGRLQRQEEGSLDDLLLHHGPLLRYVIAPIVQDAQEREDDIFAAFSPPKDGENFRGYVTYTTSRLQEGWYLSSWLNYTYLRTWLQYPVCSAMQWCLQRGMFNNDPLVTVQHPFMLQCSEDGWKVG